MTTTEEKPEEKKQFEAVFTSAFAQIEGDKGFRKNNVANALTFLIVASLTVALERDVPEADADALVVGLNDLLGADPDFKKLAAKDKQQLYEGSIVIGGLIGGLYSAALENKDAALKKQAQELARGMLAKFGVKL